MFGSSFTKYKNEIMANTAPRTCLIYRIYFSTNQMGQLSLQRMVLETPLSQSPSCLLLFLLISRSYETALTRTGMPTTCAAIKLPASSLSRSVDAAQIRQRNPVVVGREVTLQSLSVGHMLHQYGTSRHHGFLLPSCRNRIRTYRDLSTHETPDHLQ